MRLWLVILASAACLTGVACKPQQASSAAQAPTEPTSVNGFPVIIDDFAGFEYGTTMTNLPPFSHGDVAVFEDPSLTEDTKQIMVTLQNDPVAPDVSVEELGRNIMIAGASNGVKIDVVSQEKDGEWTITNGKAVMPGEPGEGSLHEALKMTPGGYVVILGLFEKSQADVMVPRWKQFYHSVRIRAEALNQQH